MRARIGQITSKAATACVVLPAAFAAALLAAALCVPAFVPALAWAEEDSPARNQVYVGQLPDSSFLYETSIADLAQASSYYEGQTVMVRGEVVGDRVNDEVDTNRCWITLQDDAETPSVISVVMDKSQTEAIDTYGRYGLRGTTLQVRGTFHLSCRDHQGATDIHVEDVAATAEGQAISSSIDGRVLAAGFIATAAGLALLVVYHLRRERSL